jgi:hypothetical protein
MTKKERKLLEAKSGIGKPVWFKFKGKPGRRLWGTVEDEVSIIVNDYKHLIQRIKLETGFKKSDSSDHKHAYRIGYYTLTAKTRKLVWGQFAAIHFEDDFQTLVRMAHEKGWLDLSKS